MIGSKTHVGPSVKSDREPWPRVQDCPEHDRHQDRKGHHGCVKEAVESLQGSGPAGQEGRSGAYVGEGVKGRKEEVEGKAPKCQVCKV